MKRMLLEAPAAEPVTLAEVKAHLRIDTDDEEELIGALAVAARVWVETEIRRVTIEQTWRAFVGDWPDEGVELPVQPALSVETVRSVDELGVGTALDEEAYAFDAAEGSVRLVAPVAGAASYEIDFTAGYGAAGEDVPQPLRQAVLMLTAHWYEHRSAVMEDAGAKGTPLGARELVAPYRRMMLC